MSSFKIKYIITETEPTKAYSAINTTQDNFVTDMNGGCIYYVFAEASKKGIMTISSNYIKINTSHTHTGNKTSSGGCYNSSYTICLGGYGMYAILNFDTITSKKSTMTSNRYCTICGKSIKKGDNYWSGSAKGSFKYYCKNCDGNRSGTALSAVSWICTSCEASKSNRILPNGNIINNAYSLSVDRLRAVTTGQASADNGVTQRGLISSSHNKVYTRNCGKNQQNASATSINF